MTSKILCPLCGNEAEQMRDRSEVYLINYPSCGNFQITLECRADLPSASSHAVELKDVDVLSCREKAEPPTTLEEERRLMYVAVTRAKQKLYVTFPKTIQDKPCGRSGFLKELNLPIIDSDKVNPVGAAVAVL